MRGMQQITFRNWLDGEDRPSHESHQLTPEEFISGVWRPTIIRVDQPPRPGHGGFVAAIEVDVLTGRVVAAAPILRWAIGQNWDAVKERGRRWGWKLEQVKWRRAVWQAAHT